MKRRISLRLLIILAFLLLSVVLVVGYSFLSAHYFMRGTDSGMSGNLEQIVRNYVRLVPAEERNRANDFDGVRISRNWNQMSDDVRAAFKQPPTELGVLYKHKESKWFKGPDVIYFAISFDVGGEIYYVSQLGTRELAPAIIGQNAADSLRLLLLVSCSIVVSLAVILWLLVRHVSEPVSALGKWARDLNAENLTEPLPDFSYPELSELAVLIRSSLTSVQESLEREHRFLRYASHELRTPIAVIRSNTELMKKLKEQSGKGREKDEVKVIERLDRAGRNMQHLTETLLWLSFDNVDSLPRERIQLDSLLKELVEEMQYLLMGKNIQISLSTEPATVFQPETPLRIVLGNLVRNAFQYTTEGKVSLEQRRDQVIITNEQTYAGTDEHELGFGFGLQMTSQLSEKLDWYYSNDKGPKGHRVIIDFAKESSLFIENIAT